MSQIDEVIGLMREVANLRAQLAAAESEGRAQFDRLRAQIDALKSERDRLAEALQLAESVVHAASAVASYVEEAPEVNESGEDGSYLCQEVRGDDERVQRLYEALVEWEALTPPAHDRPEAEAKHSPNCSVFTTVGPAFCDCRVKPAAEAACRGCDADGSGYMLTHTCGKEPSHG